MLLSRLPQLVTTFRAILVLKAHLLPDPNLFATDP